MLHRVRTVRAAIFVTSVSPVHVLRQRIRTDDEHILCSACPDELACSNCRQDEPRACSGEVKCDTARDTKL